MTSDSEEGLYQQLVTMRGRIACLRSAAEGHTAPDLLFNRIDAIDLALKAMEAIVVDAEKPQGGACPSNS